MKDIPKEIREYVTHRDKVCRMCGKRLTDSHIHHIYGRYSCIPDYLGVPPTPNSNHPFNLIRLCPVCHMEVHISGMMAGLREAFVKCNKELAEIEIYWIPEDLEKFFRSKIGGRN